MRGSTVKYFNAKNTCILSDHYCAYTFYHFIALHVCINFVDLILPARNAEYLLTHTPTHTHTPGLTPASEELKKLNVPVVEEESDSENEEKMAEEYEEVKDGDSEAVATDMPLD